MSQERIAAIKADLERQGVPLDGANAFRIIWQFAWEHRAEGFGFLSKGAGSRAVPQLDGTILSGDQTSEAGYAVDYLIQMPSGVGYDCLGDGGGKNIPQFALEDAPDMVERNLSGRWVPPPAPRLSAPVVVGPLPSVEVPTQEASEFSVINAKLDALRIQADANRDQIQAQIDQVVKNAEKSIAAATAQAGGPSALIKLLTLGFKR